MPTLLKRGASHSLISTGNSPRGQGLEICRVEASSVLNHLSLGATTFAADNYLLRSLASKASVCSMTTGEGLSG